MPNILCLRREQKLLEQQLGLLLLASLDQQMMLLARHQRLIDVIYVKKLISLKHCVRSQITRLKLQKSFCDLEHGASL